MKGRSSENPIRKVGMLVGTIGAGLMFVVPALANETPGIEESHLLARGLGFLLLVAGAALHVFGVRRDREVNDDPRGDDLVPLVLEAVFAYVVIAVVVFVISLLL